MNERARAYARRLATLRDAAAAAGAPTVVLTDPANILYLTGYWTILSTMGPQALVVTADRVVLVVPALERATVAFLGLPWIEMRGYRNYSLRVGPTVDPSRTFVDVLRACLPATREALGTELEAARHVVFQEVFSPDQREVVDIGGTLRRLRAEKDTFELARLRRAAEIAVEAATAARARIAAGASEQDVAAIIAERIWARGARATHVVVASGARSVVLHAEPAARAPYDGDLVVFDIGVLFEGYWAEIARTMVVGHPSDEQEAWHRVVLSAQTMAAARLEPGRPAAVVDAAARDAIARAGYDGSCFNHAAGHGLGLLGMDVPMIAPDSADRLPTSCALTLEPGLYFQGRGGIRIEDTYLLDRGQVEELTGSVPKGLR